MAERAEDLPAAGEAYIAGEENALVRVLAAAVVQAVLRFNPIVLCGPTGVGKSTVARELVAQRRRALALANVVETSGADLARSFMHAADVHATEQFRARHQRCDALLVDECQAISGKAAAQQFLASTIDALVRRGSLVIVTMPQSPLVTRKLAPALASRLAGGLVVTLAHPGIEARCELVRRLGERMSLSLAEDEIERLAGRRRKSMERFLTATQLRAAVLRLASTRLAGRGELVETEKVAPLEHAGEKAICRQVCVVVARQFGITAGKIRGKSRCKSIVEARAVAMYVSRKLTGVSFGRIGKQFGGLDHTTVLHACKKMAAAIEQDPVLGRLTEDLARQVSGG